VSITLLDIMAPTVKYAQALRAIGQDLEGKHPRNFNLVIVGDSFVVRGKAGLAPFFRAFELNYSAGDIERLEREGWGKRINSTGMPDFLSLSQVLRAVGCYVDLKGGCLQRASKENQSMTIAYATDVSQNNREVCQISMLYDFCVRMYLQRSGRNASMDVEENG
jgi:hypothetical protein